MKRLIPTFVVLIACVVAFGYAQQQNFFRKDDSKPKPLITFDVTQVVNLVIADGNDTVEVSRQSVNASWVFVKPESFPVNADQIGYWLDDYTRLENIGRVVDSDDELGNYGLQNPVASFRIQLSDGTTHTLLLGDVLPIGSSMYAKWKEQPGIFQLGPKDVNRLQKSAFDFVDKQLARPSFERVTKMTFQWRGITWELLKTKSADSVFDTKWTLNGGAEFGYMPASDIMDKLAFLKTELPLVPKNEMPASDNPDFIYTIEQAGVEGVSGWSKTFIGFEAEDGTIRVREQNGSYWYILQPESIKAAANQPFQQ